MSSRKDSNTLGDFTQSVASLKGDVPLKSSTYNGNRPLVVLYIGVVYCLLYIAFNANQNLQSTVNKQLGFVSLATVYGGYAITNFFAPPIVKFLGLKFSMIIGCLCIVLYFLANFYIIIYSLLAASLVAGIGVSILWTAQGAYLSACSTDGTIGFNSGIFFGAFQCNQIFGNLLSGILIAQIKIDAEYLFLVFAGIGVASAILAGFSRRVDKQQDTSKKARKLNFGAFLKLTIQPRTLTLIPAMAFLGFNQSFAMGIFTKEIDNIKLVPFVMISFGACDMLGSLIAGKINDWFGKYVVLIIPLLSVAGVTATFFTLTIVRIREDLTFVFYILAGLNGITDATCINVLYSVLGTKFRDDKVTIFAIFRFFFSLAVVAFYLFAGYFHEDENLIYISACVVISFFVLSFIGYILNDRCTKKAEANLLEVTAGLLSDDALIN